MFCRVLDKHKSLEFCEDSTLSLKIMDDMSKLRLRNWSFIRVKVVLNKNTHGFHKTLDDVENAQQNSSAHYRLSPVKERLICQEICAGLGR